MIWFLMVKLKHYLIKFWICIYINNIYTIQYKLNIEKMPYTHFYNLSSIKKGNYLEIWKEM